MKKLELNQMEGLEGGSWWDDVVVGVSCGATLVLVATVAFAPAAVLTGPACVVGLIGYGLKKY